MSWARMTVDSRHLDLLRQHQVMFLPQDDGSILVPPADQDMIVRLIQQNEFMTEAPRPVPTPRPQRPARPETPGILVRIANPEPVQVEETEPSEGVSEDRVSITGEALLKRILTVKHLNLLMDNNINDVSLRRSMPDANDTGLAIVWRSGMGLANTHLPQKLQFGDKVFERTEFSAIERVSPGETAVIPDDAGTPVWQIGKRWVRLLVNPNSVELTRHLIRTGIELYFDGWAVGVGMASAREMRRVELNRSAESLLRAGVTGQVNAYKVKIRSLSGEVTSLESNLFKKNRELSEAEILVSSLQSQSGTMQVNGFIDRVLAIPEVADIRFEGERMMVLELNPFESKVRQNGREIARIKTYGYTVKFDFANGRVNIRGKVRKTYSSNTWEHPHVQNETPCWGNISSQVSNLLASYNMYNIAILIIQYLKSVNANDGYGAHWVEWEQVGEDKGRRKSR